MNPKKLDQTTISVASQQEVMKYENIHIIERFMQSWDISLELSTDIFNEMKNWMWLCAESAADKVAGRKTPSLAVTYSMTLLDEMWHAFILFTKDYTDFCKKYFGFYIHHGPTTDAQKEEIKSEIEVSPDQYMEELEKDLTFQYEYIYEKLGEKTLQKWYSDWTDLFTPEYLNKHYKKQW